MMTTVQTIILVAEILGALGVITAAVKTTKSTSKDKIKDYISEAMSPEFKNIEHNINDVKKDIKSMKHSTDVQFKEIKENSDKKEMQRLRYECLRFASDLRKCEPKTRQEYEEIFRMEDSYNSLIEKYNIENGFMHEEMLYVHNQYRSLINK